MGADADPRVRIKSSSDTGQIGCLWVRLKVGNKLILASHGKVTRTHKFKIVSDQSLRKFCIGSGS